MKKNQLFLMFMLTTALALSACDQKKKEQSASQENVQGEVAPVAPTPEAPAKDAQQTPIEPVAPEPTTVPESSETMAPVPEKPVDAAPESIPPVDVPAGENQASQTGN